MNFNNSAVCIIGYNRVDYISQVIKSIERTEEKDILPFYFFIDNNNDGKGEEIKKVIEDSSIKNKYFILRPTNIGCGRNHIEAKVELFEKYDGLFVLEDDLIVSKNFFKILYNLYLWSKKTYNNVGVVQAYQECLQDYKWKEERLNIISNRNDHWWGYFIPKSTWDIIKIKVLEYYENCIKDCAYKERHGCRELTAKWASEAILKFEEGNFEPKFTGGDIFKGTGQDAIMNISTYLSNLERLSTVVNHVKNIGVDGINFCRKIYEKFHLHEINLDEFDTIPTEFSR